ncbi:MAG: polysaccharide biosynthesis tyrosine autokinase [Phycisphaeraceae bacterium]|nr:polysaccharide biosynthesis tyrosine autokinase [Phycisphaeraceae bacterium]
MTMNVPRTQAPASTSGQTSFALAGRFKPVDPVRVIREHLRLILLAGVIGVVVGAALWVTLRILMPRWISVAQLRISDSPDSGLSPSREGMLRGQMDVVEAKKATEAAILNSETVLNQALAQLQDTDWFKNQYVRADGQADFTDARDNLMDYLSVIPVRGSTYIEVRYRSGYRDMTPRILNTVIDQYITTKKNQANNATSDVRAVWVQQREDNARSLRDVQDQIRQFSVQNDVEGLDTRYNSQTVMLQQMATGLAELTMQFQSAQEASKRLQDAQQQGEILYDPTAIAEIRMDPAVQSREEKLRLIREEKGVMLRRFGANHSRVLDLDRRYTEVEMELKNEIDRLLRQRQQVQLESTVQAAKSLAEQLNQGQVKMDQMRAEVKDLTAKLEKYTQLKDLEKRFLDRQEQLDQAMNDAWAMSRRPDVLTVEVISRATEPEVVFPLWYVIVPMTTLLFIGAAGGVVFLMEMMDQRFKGPSDVGLLPKARLLAVIPDTTEDPTGSQVIEGIVAAEPNGLLAESFRNMRTAVGLALEKKNYKTLLVTSAQAQAGVTAIVSNLASSIGSQGKKVLVIDANLLRPALHKVFNLSPGQGLVGVMRTGGSWSAAVLKSSHPGVFLLPAGDSSQAEPELLARPAFAKLLAEASEQYDLVLIDTAPVLVGSEAKLVAHTAQASLMVIRAMLDKRGMLGRALRELGEQPAEILGVLLNRTRASAGGYFRENYQAFHRYRQQEPGTEPQPDHVGA